MTKKKQTKKIVYKILFVIFLICFIVSAFLLLYDYYKSKQTEKDLEALQKSVITVVDKGSGNESADSNNEKSDSEKEEIIFYDFSKIQELNSDIIGWISVDGTNIDYPLLCSLTDNNYYLRHNYKAEYDDNGSIYIENLNNTDFSDFNTVIYGHSMLNGTMFRSLHNFCDSSFFNQYGDITVYLPGKTLKYRVFECAYLDNVHILSKLDNSSESSIYEFITALTKDYSVVNYRYESELTAESKIITLSTCTNNDDSRLGVFAVLIEAQYAEDQ